MSAAEVGAGRTAGAGRRWSRRELAGSAWLAALAAAAAVATPRAGPRAGDLARLIPSTAGPWRRVDSPAADIVPQLGEPSEADQLLTRVYAAAGHPDVMLAAAYHPPLSDGSRVHRPEVCYVVGGFAITDFTPAVVRLSDRIEAPARTFTAERSGRREAVLYWTRVGAAFPTNVTAQRLAILGEGVRGRAADGLLLRLSVIAPAGGDASAVLQAFAGALFGAADPAGRRLLAGPAA